MLKSFSTPVMNYEVFVSFYVVARRVSLFNALRFKAVVDEAFISQS